jgi:hypothetical protein
VTRSLGSMIALALAFVAGCQAGGPTATQAGQGSSRPGDATPTLDTPRSFGPPPSPTPTDEDSPVVLDPSVLAILPERVSNIPVTESVDEASQALADPSLPRIASAMDAGVAADVGSGNLVYAWVVRVRPERLTDEIYRQWRDSYDEGACGEAGGAVARAEATIDGRTVYITSCAQGLRTYHVWLEDQAILISASATGSGNFGELLMDNLRVPGVTPT